MKAAEKLYIDFYAAVPVLPGGQNINLQLSPIFLQKSEENFEKFLQISEKNLQVFKAYFKIVKNVIMRNGY